MMGDWPESGTIISLIEPSVTVTPTITHTPQPTATITPTTTDTPQPTATVTPTTTDTPQPTATATPRQPNPTLTPTPVSLTVLSTPNLIEYTGRRFIWEWDEAQLKDINIDWYYDFKILKIGFL